MMIAFILLGALTLVGGVITIAARNAVHASLGLVGTLISVAGLFATLNASFLAATQVIVYAGAIMVLFLFVIMLLNANAPITGRDPIPFVRELAGLGGVVLAGSFVILAVSYKDPLPLAAATTALGGGSASVIGETLLTRFLLPFEAVSILLLVAIVGAVALVQRPVAQPDNVPDSEAELLAPPVGSAISRGGQQPAFQQQSLQHKNDEGEVRA
ncbi:NADH-quinone oxidoreductase subunit J family protein [Deinococcus arenicola]|uniref:NADH-quinone oxidoreductase subunit J n=1 Tax=Deinococcus arenicola TaxID=2994950 RepID=A0ABU4DPW3_9DEIO|nr:NADH-quinone oxidoreductase subunit J [Deinococcus sp. ZS9-10]MDV6374469.1 NADH-quinone oxidoreductase subunit J [Deinococcus sp. ZS9-10]